MALLEFADILAVGVIACGAAVMAVCCARFRGVRELAARFPARGRVTAPGRSVGGKARRARGCCGRVCPGG